MLNISFNSVRDQIDRNRFTVFKKLEERSNTRSLLIILSVLGIIGFLSLWLPWTQNIRTTGTVSTLNPFDKPQDVQTLISGRIEKWLVKEGQIVNIGDTLAIIKEAKDEYLDPDIYLNTEGQQKAKLLSADAYLDKSNRLREQLLANVEYFNSKVAQIDIKQQQLLLKIQTDSIALQALDISLQNANKQLARMETMYDQGVKSLTDLENMRLKYQQALAKQNGIKNKLLEYSNEQINLNQEVQIAQADFQQKKAKIEAEIQTADSYRFSLIGESDKLQSKLNQLSQRALAYAITSPIHGTVTKVLKNGIGEFVKAQESISTIVPLDYQRAVEFYVEPMDLPLLSIGREVRLLFDGWPAVVFSGWPDNSIGTFGGKIFAIDNDISENNKYRILVVEDVDQPQWPELVRIGSGAKGLILLNEVRVYYELWRQLNGFPADFYNKAEKKEMKEDKAPLKKVK